MIPLQTQEQFEALYKNTVLPGPILIYFTADWCGACKKIDWDFLLDCPEFESLPIYICDLDQNKYTPGFCGIRSIPNFIMMSPDKKLEQFQSNDTSKIAAWIHAGLIKNKN